MTKRLCDCGCGEPIDGPPAKRFLNEQHRKHYHTQRGRVDTSRTVVCALDGCDEEFVTDAQTQKKYHSARCRNAAVRQRGRPPSVPEGEEESPYARLPGQIDADTLTYDTLFRRREERQAVHFVDKRSITEGERAIFLSDLHIPFHDAALLGAIDRFIVDFGPDRIVYAGDLCDMYCVSVFDKNPTRRFVLEDEIRAARLVLDRHAEIAPQAKRYFIDGNHEWRLIRELMKSGGEFYGLYDEDTDDPLLSIPKVFGLRKRGIEHIPWPGRVDYAGFILTHGPPPSRSVGNVKHIAKWMLEYVKSSGLSGCSHRDQVYNSIGDEGQTQGWIVQGCLCHLDPSYLPFPDWQQGFTHSTVVKGQVHPTLVTVFDRAFTAHGKVYSY